MAFASVGSLGTANNKVSGTTITIPVLAGVSVGDVIVVWIASDNINTTDADHSEVSSVTDAGSNTYTKLKEFTNGQGTAAEGATAAIWYCDVDNALSIANLITVTFASAITAKAVSAWQFTKTASNVLAVEGTPQTSVGDGADPASMTLSSLTSREYLLVAATALETIITTTYTKDADYTAITFDATSGSTGTTNMYVAGGFRIATLTTDTYDASTSAGRDNAQVYGAIYETAGGGTEYTQAVSGTLTTAGTVVKQTQVLRAGTVTSAGTVVKQAQKLLAGTLTSAGTVVDQFQKLLTGTLTTAGDLVKQTQKILAGTLTSIGTLTKQTGKQLAGTLGLSGTLTAISLFLASLAGTLGLSGELVKSTGKQLAGTLTSAGDVVKRTSKALAGTLTTAGELVKSTAKTLAGTVTSSGSLVGRAQKQLAGTLTTAGTLVKRTSHTLQGTLGLAGNVAKQMYLALAGVLSTAGSLATQLIPASAVTAIVNLTARARTFNLVANVRSFNLTARVRNFILNAKDKE